MCWIQMFFAYSKSLPHFAQGSRAKMRFWRTFFVKIFLVVVVRSIQNFHNARKDIQYFSIELLLWKNVIFRHLVAFSYKQAYISFMKQSEPKKFEST